MFFFLNNSSVSLSNHGELPSLQLIASWEINLENVDDDIIKNGHFFSLIFYCRRLLPVKNKYGYLIWVNIYLFITTNFTFIRGRVKNLWINGWIIWWWQFGLNNEWIFQSITKFLCDVKSKSMQKDELLGIWIDSFITCSILNWEVRFTILDPSWVV